MARMIVGYIVVIITDDQDKSYHGPFFTEDRARRYAESDTAIVDYTILPLVIPHHLVLDATDHMEGK